MKNRSKQLSSPASSRQHSRSRPLPDLPGELRVRTAPMVGTTNVTVTNTSGKKETEDAPIVKRGAVVTLTEAAASATYTVKAYDGMGNPIRILMRLLER